MYKLDILDKETEKLHQLLKLIKDNKNQEDKVWENFCKEMDKVKDPATKYFQKHPKNMSNSSSEIFSPRQNDSCLRKSDKPNRAKSTNSIRSSQPRGNPYIVEVVSPNMSDMSVEVVTLREEYPNRKKLKTHENSKNVRISKSADRTLIKSRDNIKQVKINEKSSLDSVTKRKSLNKLKKCGSKDVQGAEIASEMYKDNFELKLHSVIEKSLMCMEDIRIQLDIGITQPDGLDDFERRKRRSSEFASRFSRNYLYQLNRQVSDIKKILKPSSRLNNQSCSIIRQKISSSFQTVLQGLQAYLTHLPISTSMAVPEKIKELLREISTLCEIQRCFANSDVNSNIKSTELVDIFEVRSRCLIDKVDECYSAPSVVTLLQSVSKFSLMQTGKTRKKNAIKTRYSMYNGSSGRKEVYWKRAVAALAKKKYNVPSKYKTAHFKHRPPIERSSNTKQPTIKAKPLERKSSTNLKAKPVVDDENIRTMMEIEREKDQELSAIVSTVSFQKTEDDFSMKSDTLVPLVEKLIEKLKVENKDMTQEHVRCVLQGIAENAENAAKPTDSDNVIGDLAAKSVVAEEIPKRSHDVRSLNERLVGKLVEVIKNHGKGRCCEKRHEEIEHEQVDGKISKKKKRKDRKKTVTVTGAKNAQLICIRDEDSLNETNQDENVTEGIPACNHSNKSKSKLQINNQTISIQNENVNFQNDNVQQSISSEVIPRLGSNERASRIKISRLPKVPLQPLKMLPKKFALNVLEYKINYLKARKGDHMYKKSSIKQPWILMGEISDKILDELLQAIGSEIEVNDVIEGIFASELI